MPRKFRTFADALTAVPTETVVDAPSPIPIAANDNRPMQRYRGTLPLLRWLFHNHADLAPAMAASLERIGEPNPYAGAFDNSHEIRPTPAELLRAAEGNTPTIEVRGEGKGAEKWVRVGELAFQRGKLREWGATKAGKALRPVDRVRSGDEPRPNRDPGLYLRTRPTTPSPLTTEPLRRGVEFAPALPPMLAEQPGVAANRKALAEAYARSPDVPVTRCQTVVAKGARFIGGVVGTGGTESKSAPRMWDGPEERRPEFYEVMDEVLARGTLRSLGLRLGYSESYADKAGARALIDAAKSIAANDNKKSKKAA